MAWSASDIPTLRGRTAIVTGGNGGLGLHTAAALAQQGADVVIAARNPEKAEAALNTIRALTPEARVEA